MLNKRERVMEDRKVRDGNCTNAGSKRKFVRLFFYLSGIVCISAIAILALSMRLQGSADAPSIGDISVTFVLNNGQANITCTGENEIPSPTMEGYYLSGWYTDSGLTERIEFKSYEEILENADRFQSGDYRLYAKWERLKEMKGVRIADTFFIYDGKAHYADISGQPDGAEIRYLDNGHIDAGEYTVSARVSAYGYKDLVIYGKLVIGKARIDESELSFEDAAYAWDGEEKRIEIEGELPDGVAVTYYNNGHRDVGEYEVTAHFDVGGNYEEIADRRAKLTIYGITHKVTLVEEDGERREITVTQGQSSDGLPKPKEKRGYTGRWSIEELGSISGDIEVYAVYEPITYVIEYGINGGSIDGEKKEEYTVLDEVQLPSAHREHYEFKGWYGNSDFDGDKIERISVGSVGNKTYYAKWEAIRYEITYEMRGGTNNKANVVEGGESYVYTVESETLILENATRKGYTFAGFKDKDGNEVKEIGAKNAGSYTLYAEWEITVYGITYVLNGGENAESNPISYTVEDGETVLLDPTKPKHVFMGWYENGVGARVEHINGDLCRDITLCAIWEEARFEINEDGIITGYDYYFGYNVCIPDTVYGVAVSGIAEGVLSEAESVEICAGIEEIGKRTFRGCANLRELKLPETLKSLPDGILADCVNLQRLSVPYVTNRRPDGESGDYYPLCELFGREKRDGCYEVKVRKSVYANGEYDCTDTSEEAYVCYVPNSLSELTVACGEITPYSLSGLASLKRITVEGDARIGVMALNGCAGLETLILGNIDRIATSALTGCTALKEIYISKQADESKLEGALKRLSGQNVQIIK